MLMSAAMLLDYAYDRRYTLLRRLIAQMLLSLPLRFFDFTAVSSPATLPCLCAARRHDAMPPAA